MISYRGLAQPAEIDKQFKSLPPFPPGVVKVRYTLEDDWTGEPVIFFWITLSDDAARDEVLHQTSRQVRDFITERLDPMAQWGLFPHFYVRSQSEQEQLKDPAFG